MEPRPLKYVEPTGELEELVFEPEPVTIYNLPENGGGDDGPATEITLEALEEALKLLPGYSDQGDSVLMISNGALTWGFPDPPSN